MLWNVLALSVFLLCCFFYLLLSVSGTTTLLLGKLLNNILWLPSYKDLLINSAAFHVHSYVKKYRVCQQVKGLSFHITLTSNSPSPSRGGSGPVFSKWMTTPLWTFWTRDSRHWFSILWVRTQYDRPETNQQAQLCGDALLAHYLLAKAYLPATLIRFCACLCLSLLEVDIYR